MERDEMEDEVSLLDDRDSDGMVWSWKKLSNSRRERRKKEEEKKKKKKRKRRGKNDLICGF